MSSVSFDSANAKFGSALRFPTNAWVETNAFASNLGIGGGSKRTISFGYMQKMEIMEIEVHTASGKGGVLIVLI